MLVGIKHLVIFGEVNFVAIGRRLDSLPLASSAIQLGRIVDRTLTHSCLRLFVLCIVLCLLVLLCIVFFCSVEFPLESGDPLHLFSDAT